MPTAREVRRPGPNHRQKVETQIGRLDIREHLPLGVNLLLANSHRSDLGRRYNPNIGIVQPVENDALEPVTAFPTPYQNSEL